jgi:hypothetical protein
MHTPQGYNPNTMMWDNTREDMHHERIGTPDMMEFPPHRQPKFNPHEDMVRTPLHHHQQQQWAAGDFAGGRASPSIMTGNDFSQPSTPGIMMSPDMNNNDRLLLQLQSRQRQILMQQEQILILREQMMRQQQQQQLGIQQQQPALPNINTGMAPTGYYPSANPVSVPTTPSSPARNRGVMTPVLHEPSSSTTTETVVPIIRSPLLEEFRNNKNKKFGLKVNVDALRSSVKKHSHRR